MELLFIGTANGTNKFLNKIVLSYGKRKFY